MNINLMVENVIQIKIEITINVELCIICTQKIIFGILVHVLAKMLKIWEVLLSTQ